MKCPKCGGENRPESKYCVYCGTPFSSVCPICGEQIENDALYCPKCGAKIERDGEKKKKVEYKRGFRYAWCVSNILLLLECVISFIMILKSFETASIHAPGYFSYYASSFLPPYTLAIFVLSIITYFGLGKFKKSSYVLLLVLHAFLLLRDINGIRRFFYSIWAILFVVALLLHILSLIYFASRSKYYNR